jgi:hypothetical protein
MQATWDPIRQCLVHTTPNRKKARVLVSFVGPSIDKQVVVSGGPLGIERYTAMAGANHVGEWHFAGERIEVELWLNGIKVTPYVQDRDGHRWRWDGGPDSVIIVIDEVDVGGGRPKP